MDENLSIPSDSRCPFCDATFKAGARTTRSNINKHIKKMAHKTDERRGNHPRIGTQAFAEIARQRGFREVAPSEAVRKQKEIARKRKWRSKGNEEKASDMDLDVDLDVDQHNPQTIDSKILARVEFAFERLRYVISQKLLRITRSDIEDPEIIPKPAETLCDNPSFPELAFHYLDLDTDLNHNRRNSPHRSPYCLNDCHYLLLRSYCSMNVLETAWKEWQTLKNSQDGESQQKMLWERAKEMEIRRDLYRKVWDGLHSQYPETHECFKFQCFQRGVVDPETHKCFKFQCFQRGVVELKSLLDRGVEWEALTWKTFGDFEVLYEPLPVSGRGCAGENIIHAESFVHARTPRYKVIYGTPSPECEPWKEDERGSPELELMRENRAASRSPEL